MTEDYDAFQLEAFVHSSEVQFSLYIVGYIRQSQGNQPFIDTTQII